MRVEERSEPVGRVGIAELEELEGSPIGALGDPRTMEKLGERFVGVVVDVGRKNLPDPVVI